MFEDGAETRMECNKCVCACGNWVCTALTCTGAVTFAHTADVTVTALFCELTLCFCTPIMCIPGEHQAQEHVKEGEEEEEMTEEEWSRRVAELNALQVDDEN